MPLLAAGNATYALTVNAEETPLPGQAPRGPDALLLNADGYGYGLFPVDPQTLSDWQALPALPLASLMISSYEQMLETGSPTPQDYLSQVVDIAVAADEQLLIDLALGQAHHIFWSLINDARRQSLAADVESRIWEAMQRHESESLRKILFNAYADFAVTAGAVERVAEVWSGKQQLNALSISERDQLRLTQLLAIKDPEHAAQYLELQLERTENPDESRRLEFLAPSLSPDQSVRDRFFRSLADEENRRTESWVLDALKNLHHPLRTSSSARYVQESLDLLEEIQVTGDIFFPAGWINLTLRNHHSARVAGRVNTFLAERPGYNPQLKMKILQAADPVFRGLRLREAEPGQ